MIIAIDGPSGTGKTTVARKVAQRLNFAYFDTGATYRAITWFFLQRKTPLEEEKQIKKALEGFEFSFKAVGQERRYFVGPEDVTTAIRTPLVTRFVSQVSALRPVREVVWKRQRDAAKGQDAVFEGRDMGTVVFPDADLGYRAPSSGSSRGLDRVLSAICACSGRRPRTTCRRGPPRGAGRGMDRPCRPDVAP